MEVYVNNTSVPLSSLHDLYFSSVDMTSRPEIRINGIGSEVINTRLTESRPEFFWNPEQRGPRLVLWPEVNDAASSDSTLCTDLGIYPGDILQTDKIQKAIDTVGENGGTLVFPAGIYRTGTLRMQSGVTLHLNKGSELRGTNDPRDYPRDPDTKEEGTNGEYMTFSRLILFDGVQDAGITGQGIIRAGGKQLRLAGRAANTIRIRQSKNITISGVVVLDAAAWTVHILKSENVTVRGVKILNDLGNKNTDGVDPDSSTNVLIEDSFMYCGDDCIAVKTTRNGGLLDECRNIIVRNNTFFTLKAAQKVGTESFADIKDVTFEDNRVIYADRVIGIYNFDGAHFDKIRFKGTIVEHSRIYKATEIKDRNGVGTIGEVIVE